MNSINYVSVNGSDYVRIQTLAEALGVCTASLYAWRRAGYIEFCWPLGRALTFVPREIAERLLRLRITNAMGAFVNTMEA